MYPTFTGPTHILRGNAANPAQDLDISQFKVAQLVQSFFGECVSILTGTWWSNLGIEPTEPERDHKTCHG